MFVTFNLIAEPVDGPGRCF